MNLLADEGVDWPIVEQLRRDGHDVIYVAEMEPGIPMILCFSRQMNIKPCLSRKIKITASWCIVEVWLIVVLF